VFPAEHLLRFAGLDFLVERVERLHVLAVHRLAGFSPFGEDRQVVLLLPERLNQVAVLLEAPAPLQDFLRFCLVSPEIGSRGACLDACEFVVGSCGFKDSYADRQRVG
jgi:hypothetical protein